MKRFFCVVMTLALLLGVAVLFAGCGGASVGEPEETQEAPKYAIVENGVCNYTIVYPEVYTAAETDAVDLLKEKIKEVTDVRIKSMSEEFLKADEELRIIYVGNTSFEPAVAAKEQLCSEYFDSYVIDVSDGDIYMVAASDSALFAAVEYFVENLLEKNFDAATNTLYFEGCRYDGSEVFPTGFSVDNIKEYSIVYASNGLNFLNLAKSLQSVIEKKTGFAPDIFKDTEKSVGTFEILLGETTRALSKRCYSDSARILEYEYVIEGCQLQLVFGGLYSGRKSVEDFSFRILRNKDEYLSSGSYYKTNMAEVEQGLTSGSDIRIMSANVLSYRWGEASSKNVLPVAERAEIFAGVLMNYRPDAVGIQETDEPWQNSLPWYLDRLKQKDGIEYTFLFGKVSNSKKTMVNFSTIAYRSDMYNIDESGCEVYSIWEKTPNYFQRVATYVKLSAKNDPNKQFALVNTHWAHEDDATVNACAVEQAAVVNRLKEKYKDITVFCTGDYNNLDTRAWKDKYLNKLVADINGKIASSVAKEKGVLITPGGCRESLEKMGESVLRSVDNSFIDHIIMSGASCDVMRHDTIRENMTHVLSDHSLIYADIDLNYNGRSVAPESFSLKNVSDYSIVYANNGLDLYKYATELQADIKNKTGVSPRIFKDTERSEGVFEILLGETNRSLSKKCYKSSSRIMEYEFVVDGGQLQIVVGGQYSAKKALEAFERSILPNVDKKFISGSYYKTDMAEVEQALTSGSDVRIMSANVLSYRWGEKKSSNVLPVAERVEIFAGVLKNYRPDAVGIQETDEPWQESLPWYFKRLKENDGIEYNFLFETLSNETKTMVNFSTIAYRSDMYDLDESGYKIFSIWTNTPNYFQRVATYVKLTAKNDPNKQFALVNTHWAHEDAETVNACAVEQAELVNSIKEKYNDITVFCTGDYNNLTTRDWGDTYLNKLVLEINGKIASTVAKENGVLITAGGCREKLANMSEDNPRAVDDSFIDHIIMSGADCEVKRHDTIRENKTHILSDHSLIYADIDLK